MSPINLRAATLAAALTTLTLPAAAAAAPLYSELEVHTGTQSYITAKTTSTPQLELSLRRGEAGTLLKSVPMTECGGGMMCATLPVGTLLPNDRATIDQYLKPASDSHIRRTIVVYEGVPKLGPATCLATGGTRLSAQLDLSPHWKQVQLGVVGGAEAGGLETAGSVASGTYTGVIGAGAQGYVRQSYSYATPSEQGIIGTTHTAPVGACAGLGAVEGPVLPPGPPVVESQSPPPPPPPVDAIAPQAMLKLRPTARLTVLRTRGLTSTVTVDEAATVTQQLRLGRTVIGRGSAKASAPSDVKVTIKLTKAGARSLRGRRRAKLVVRTTARDTAGNVRTLPATSVTVRR